MTVEEELRQLRFLVRERREVREYLDSDSPWRPVVLVEAENALTDAAQRLVDLGLTEAELKQWLAEIPVEVRYYNETVRRMEAAEA